MARIERLPEDILLKILLYNTGQLLSKTHVCRSWRTIALGYPLLWSEVYVGHSRNRLDSFLVLSQSVPISVHVNLCPSRERCNNMCFNNMMLALEQLSRIRTLNIEAQERILQDPEMLALRNVFSRNSTTMLETLRMNFFRCGDYLFLSDFSHSVMALRNVYLTDIALPWTPLIFRDLSRLHIYVSQEKYRKKEYALTIEPSELLAILRACPQLEQLFVKGFDQGNRANVSRRTSDFPPFSEESLINMPALTDITLDGIEVGKCSKLAQRIVTPMDANWNFIMEYPTSHRRQPFIDLIEGFCAQYPLGKDEYRSVKLTFSERSISFCITRFATEEENTRKLSQLKNKKMTIAFQEVLIDGYTYQDVYLSDIVSTIASFIQAVDRINPVLHFHFIDKSNCLSVSWLRAFRMMPLLRYLTLEFDCDPKGYSRIPSVAASDVLTRDEVAVKFFDGLSAPLSDPRREPETNNASRLIIFPRISDLEIFCSKNYLEDVTRVPELVLRCLLNRKDSEKGASRLHFLGFHGLENVDNSRRPLSNNIFSVFSHLTETLDTGIDSI